MSAAGVSFDRHCVRVAAVRCCHPPGGGAEMSGGVAKQGKV